jgi:hypothetical protein
VRGRSRFPPGMTDRETKAKTKTKAVTSECCHDCALLAGYCSQEGIRSYIQLAIYCRINLKD